MIDTENTEKALNPGLTFRRPDELLAMTFNESDNLLGDRLLSKGNSLVILGQGGIGKSFLNLQLIVASIVGWPFLGFETRAQGLKWLLFQAENNNRRLQFDLLRLREWVGIERWKVVQSRMILHTLECEQDFLLDIVSDEGVYTRCLRGIEEHEPDIVAWDPLKDATLEDLKGDREMLAACHALSSLSRWGNPNRGLVLTHHSLTGLAGIVKVTGFDRSSFGRNSKALHQWARAVINVAAATEDYRKLVIGCGKNNNGAEFKPFGILRNPETMIYEVDPSFDLCAWETEVAGRRKKPVEITPTEVAELLTERPLSKSELVKEIMDEYGRGKSQAYAAVSKATGKTIVRDKSTKKFSKKSRETRSYDHDE